MAKNLVMALLGVLGVANLHAAEGAWQYYVTPVTASTSIESYGSSESDAEHNALIRCDTVADQRRQAGDYVLAKRAVVEWDQRTSWYKARCQLLLIRR